jgi:energy-coupling factor transporter ATP-binding protein EcfA2
MKAKKVSRIKDIEVLFEVIKNMKEYRENSENGLVILLNGSWGSGKTTFLNDFEKAISESSDYGLLCKYNSYEYDFYETAYIPFFSTIEDRLKLGNNFNKIVKCLGRDTCNFSLSTLYMVINAITKIVNVDLNDLKDNMIEIQEEDYLKNFKDFKECKEEIKKKLKKLCKKNTQIFIIDELDRCKPSFAMETLEIIKHFFDVDNCVFIIAVDKIQLQEAAKTIYGQDMDSEKYFSKFFDYQHNLFPLDFYETIDINDIEEIDIIIKQSAKIFEFLDVSTRDSKKIFNEFVIKYKNFTENNNSWSLEQSIFMIFLLTLKYIDLLFYNEILHGNYPQFSKKLINSLESKLNNYHSLLNTKIGSENETFDSVLRNLDTYFDCRYVELHRAYYSDSFRGEKYQREKNALISLMNYVPQIEVNLTYKQTIKRIIN